MTLATNIIGETPKIGVKTVLSTECGNGFKILRKDAETGRGGPLGFEVLRIGELAHRYLETVPLSIKPAPIEVRVTYNDPCYVGRKLDVFQEPQELIKPWPTILSRWGLLESLAPAVKEF